MCHVHVLGDELHFLFQYSIFNERKFLFPKYCSSTLSTEKYHVLLSIVQIMKNNVN